MIVGFLFALKYKIEYIFVIANEIVLYLEN